MKKYFKELLKASDRGEFLDIVSEFASEPHDQYALIMS